MSLFSGFIKYGISKFIDSLKIVDRCYSYLFLKQCKKFFQNSSQNEILFLQAFPYNSLDNLKVAELSIDFRLDIPEIYASRLKKYNFYTNHDEGCYNQNDRLLMKLVRFIQSNYPHINEEPLLIINRFVNTTAEFFLNELNKGKSKSNNSILGIETIRIVNKTNSEIELFTTDYFTYNCIINLYKYLYGIDKTPFQIKSIEEISRLSPFLCCCGIGGFVNLLYKGSLLSYKNISKNPVKTIKGTLISKRSNSAACPNHWHASFDETFDIRDKNNMVQGEKPSLKACLSRGLNEELGIHYNSQMHLLKNIVLFFICNKERLETEFFVSIDIEIKSEKDLKLFINRYQCASDSENENSHLLLVPTNKVFDFYTSKIRCGEAVTSEAFELSRLYNALDNDYLLSFFHYLKQL